MGNTKVDKELSHRVNLEAKVIWSPKAYAKSRVVAKEAADVLLSRLNLMSFQPKTILDIGCGLGEEGQKLASLYPQSKVYGLDNNLDMIEAAIKEPSISCLLGEAYDLPFRSQSIDLIFANFFLPWCADYKLFFSECRRVLSPEGLILFSTLGPDTLKKITPEPHLFLIDMHDIGDGLIETGYLDPVLDLSYFCLSYQDEAKLTEEMMASGMILNLAITDFKERLKQDECLSVDFEVIYGHAFAPAHTSSLTKNGMTQIPLSSIKAQLKTKL